MSDKSDKGVSVIICCYNSITRIKKTLEYLVTQQISEEIFWEIIVVDNNSTDGTYKYVNNFLKTLSPSIPFTITLENKQGLIYARERGINVAQYEYLLFCDDDNWLANNYIENTYCTFRKYPNIGMLGGWCDPISDIKIPKWFQEVNTYYAVGKLHNKSIELKNISSGVFGAGMSIKKTAFQALKLTGFQFSMTGREGNKLSGGEDFELRIGLGLLNYTCFFSTDLYFQHFIPKDRLQKAYVNKIAFEWGRTLFITSAYYHSLKKYPSSTLFYLIYFIKNILLYFFAFLKKLLHSKFHYQYLERKGMLYAQIHSKTLYFSIRKRFKYQIKEPINNKW